MRVITYNTDIEPLKGGGFFLTVPALPSCFSWGDTIDEVVARARDEIRSRVDELIACEVMSPGDYEIALSVQLNTDTLGVGGRMRVVSTSKPAKPAEILSRAGFVEGEEGGDDNIVLRDSKNPRKPLRLFARMRPQR